MDAKKIVQYNSFLLCKRDKYINSLIRVGSKLAKQGKFNRDSFSRNFLLDKEEIIKKIEETVEYEKAVHKANAAVANENASYLDNSDLINLIRPQIDNFQRDFDELQKNIGQESNASMVTAIECASNEKNPNISKRSKKVINNRRTNSVDDNKMDNVGDSHFVSQELKPGELSKIFIQKSRVDVVHSTMDKPDFDDLLETIYIFRERKC